MVIVVILLSEFALLEMIYQKKIKIIAVNQSAKTAQSDGGASKQTAEPNYAKM